MNDFMLQLGRKHELLSQVLELTKLQEDMILQDDTDALLTNIARRQKLIDELDEIQAELPDKETLRQNSECMKQITVVNGMLTQIQEQDAKNEKAALARMDDLRNQMRKVNEGRKTFSGYETGGAPDVSGIYINKGK